MKKITCLLTSPRPKGNSSTIGNYIIDNALSKGAEVQKYSLNEMNFKGCQACYACKGKLDRCIINDDLSNVIESVRNTDVPLIASPVYWYDVNVPLKAFIERCFSFLVPDYLSNKAPSRLPSGKTLIFILTQGAKEPIEIYPRYGKIFNYLGFDEDFLIHACNVRAMDDVKSRRDIFKAADKVVELLFGR